MLNPGLRKPLLTLSGQAGAAQIYMIGGTQMLTFDDPATHGDDGALLDDMLIGFNNPVDVCIWIEGLENGRYEVLTYALTPGQPAHRNRVRVDFATTGPVLIGGAFAGGYPEGLTHARHEVEITSGVVALHSGEWGAQVMSGINGIQIRRLDSCYPDCDQSGALNVNDYICFQTRFATGDPYADCDANGVRNVNDNTCFQTAFAMWYR